MASSGVYIQYILSCGCMPSRRLFHKFFNCWLYIQLALDTRKEVINIKKLLMLTLIPLILSLLAAPAMAKSIGPQKAVGKNPHIMPTPEGVEALLPSGSFNEWTANTSAWYMDFVHGLDASKAKGISHKALPLTIPDLMAVMMDPVVALEAENKWWYMSYEILVAMFIMENATWIDVLGNLTADANLGQKVVSVDNASLFSVVDEVLIVGLDYAVEVNVIDAIVDNNLTMTTDLQHTYTVGGMVIKSETAFEWASLWPQGIYVRFVNVGRAELE
jgi:hypothetical protein